MVFYYKKRDGRGMSGWHTPALEHSLKALADLYDLEYVSFYADGYHRGKK